MFPRIGKEKNSYGKYIKTHIIPAMVWYTYQHKVMALFGSDPDIRVRDLEKVSDNEYSYMMLIGSQDKAEAIKKILPGEVPIGDVTVRAAILGPDEDGENSAEEIASVCDLFRKAFTGNPHFSRVVTVRYPPGMVLNYCVFKKKLSSFGTMTCQI